MEDMYTDNYVLEDIYNLIIKYKLDSIRFSYIRSNNKKNPYKSYYKMKFSKNLTKIIYGYKDYDVKKWKYGTIWNRLTKSDIFTKGLCILDTYILNAYKNLWDDRWLNELINKFSYRNLFINRIGYLYLPNNKGERILKIKKKEKALKEIIYFYLFDLQMLPKNNNKKSIINSIKKLASKYNLYNRINISLENLKTKFEAYEYLLLLLLKDKYILKSDKKFLRNLLKQYRREIL